MTPTYPTSFDAIGPWATMAGLAIDEARVRFAQYAVLLAISRVRPLREGLVFKGGNALDFVWQPNRSTIDLDFSVDHASSLAMPDAGTIDTLLKRGLPGAMTRLGVALVVHRVRQNPPGTDRNFVTFEVKVGYALPDESRLLRRIEHGESSPRVIKVDISVNEPIGEATLFALGPDVHVRVATLEDILAEKLRALLQQPIRNRQRRQDLLDIAVVLRQNSPLDRIRISRFLQEKAAARDVLVTRSAFHHPDVVERAMADYAELEATTRVLFVPFEEALRLLHEFVGTLHIPE
ncbi:MAG: nucleotidyl transferase AbiEii/AbiGii toxin family protein [Thermomicrobiales bacterium]